MLSVLRSTVFAVLLAFACRAGAASFVTASPPSDISDAYGSYPFQFGYLTVPENHEAPNGHNLQLAVVILRALNPSPTSLPVIFLTGGPGGSATPDGAYFEIFLALQQRHDVVFIDQRGCGYSQPFLGASRGTYASIRDGFTNQGIDLTTYNTTENAADIADLRTALGYNQVILFGSSYGTFLAQEVMRSHPTGIAAVVLSGVVPPSDTFIPSFNHNTLHGLKALFRDVQRTGPARRAFPSFSRTYYELLRKLHSRPLRMSDGFKVTLDNFQGSIEALLQSPERIRYIPILTREVAAQRGSAFVRRYLGFTEGPHDFSLGMYLSVLGADWNQPGWLDLTKRTDATLRPIIFRQVNAPSSLSIALAVQAWSVPYRPQATRNLLSSTIPTLLFSGEMEAQTPFDGADLVAAVLPKSFVLSFPRSGHITGMTPGPAMDAFVQFVDNPSTRPVYSIKSLTRPNFYATTIPQKKDREMERPLRFVR